MFEYTTLRVGYRLLAEYRTKDKYHIDGYRDLKMDLTHFNRTFMNFIECANATLSVENLKFGDIYGGGYSLNSIHFHNDEGVKYITFGYDT